MNKKLNLGNSFSFLGKSTLLLLMLGLAVACGGDKTSTNPIANAPSSTANPANTPSDTAATPPATASAKVEVRSTDSTKVIQLPDGSKVLLNRSSNVSYSENESGERNVQLKGEAYFEVKKMNNKKFNVYAGNTKTTVIGTAFNIKAYDDNSDVEIEVVEGEVEFVEENDISKKESVKAKEKVVYKRSKRTMQKSASKDADSKWWLNDEKGIIKNTSKELKNVGDELKGLFKNNK